MHKKLLLITLVGLAACNNPGGSSNLPQPLELHGTIQNWPAGKTGKLRLRWIQLLTGSGAYGEVITEPIITTTDGMFTRTLPTTGIETYLSSSSNDLGNCDATVIPNNLKTIIFYELLTSANGVEVGIVQESDIPPIDSTTSPPIGSNSIWYIYSDQIGNINATCDKNSPTYTYSYNINLQKGWNAVAYSHTVVGGHTYNAFTTGKPSSTKWYLQGNLNFDRL